jgi:hypothetical protein
MAPAAETESEYRREPSSSPYIHGFLDGQATAYCEQVRLGSRLAGAINCDDEHTERLRRLVVSEACRAKVIPAEMGRVSLWIYRYEFIGTIIDRLSAQDAPDVFTVWAAGKLFGYADHEIAACIAGMETGTAT